MNHQDVNYIKMMLGLIAVALFIQSVGILFIALWAASHK